MSSGSWALPEELRQLAECGDESLIKEVLGVFRSDTTERLEKLRAAIAQDNRPQVQSEAHSMKGAAGQVGANNLAAICLQLEQQAMTAAPAALSELTDRVEAAFLDVSRVMFG
jgi:HPt (histidine-containing phosphotransfer) domain-containing protein